MSYSTFLELYHDSALLAQFRASVFKVSSTQIELWVLKARCEVARSII